MTIADRIAPLLSARQARTAARDAERAQRDTFIQAQFALLGARFEALLRAALGLHSRFTFVATTVVQPVQNRTFATIALPDWTITASFNATPQAVHFAPRLDFRAPDQFGLVECALGFPYAPRRSRADVVARTLLENGVQLRGKGTASLLLPLPDGPVELSVSHLEDAFRAWWLR
jgi:hypothetical protein